MGLDDGNVCLQASLELKDRKMDSEFIGYGTINNKIDDLRLGAPYLLKIKVALVI